MIPDPRTCMEFISLDGCWELLECQPIGRIGVLFDSAPEIYPVNYLVDDRTIVFRTEPGQKLRGIDRSPSVCFEVDHYDETSRAGWSVLVKGRASEVHSATEEHHLQGLDLRFWGVGPKPTWIRIEPAEVTGRRIIQPPDGSRTFGPSGRPAPPGTLGTVEAEGTSDGPQPPGAG